ncbi:hypothetical protein LTR95_005258 [Oleoguttula sp. CCFEE 5521]
MPTTLILGGSGKVALHLTRILTQSPYSHKVFSLIRSQDKVSQIRSLNAEPLVNSLEDLSASQLADVIKSTSASTIVWAAGAGGKGGAERTKTVDRDAAIRAMDATAQAGVKRFIMVSAVDIRDRSKPAPEWYNDDDKGKSDQMWKALGSYCQAKLEADVELVTGNEKRGLVYTIVRPSTLSDEKGTGKVEAGKVHIGQPISREDVAAVVAACVADEGTGGCVFDVVPGKTGVADAVKGLAKGKVDVFEGRY